MALSYYLNEWHSEGWGSSGIPPEPFPAALTVNTSAACVLGTGSTAAAGPCIDFAKLFGSMQTGRVYLRDAPSSAGAGNNVAGSSTDMAPGLGTYTWYISADGTIRSDP